MMTMSTFDQGMVCLPPSINLVIISTAGFCYFFPPWELMPDWKNWQKYTSAPLLWTKYQSNTLSSFRKKATRGASRQYLLHLHMTLLDGKLLMGETKYLIGGERGVFGENWARQIFSIQPIHNILQFDGY